MLLAIFILYTSAFGSFEGLIQRSAFLSLVICIGLAEYSWSKSQKLSKLSNLIDLLFAVASVWACCRIMVNHSFIMEDLPVATLTDKILITILTITILDLSRRSVGWVFTGIVALGIGYTFFGHLLTGQFGHRYYDYSFITETLYLGDLGVWGSLTNRNRSHSGFDLYCFRHLVALHRWWRWSDQYSDNNWRKKSGGRG